MLRLPSAVVLVTIAVGCGGGAGDSSLPAATTGAGDSSLQAATTAADISLYDINVVDLTVAEAEAKLKAAGWRPYTGDESDTSGGLGGDYVVVAQDPQWIICSQDFFTLVDGTRDLSLDAAPTCGTVRIPNLVGKTLTEAEKQTDALGLSTDPESSAGKHNIETDWIVCEQDPPPGPANRLQIDYVWVALEPHC